MPKEISLSERSVVERAYHIPFHSPSYGRLPLKILDRESLAISYRTDVTKARRIVPAPLEVDDPIVTLTFLYMTIPGIGEYYEMSQSILATYQGERVSFRPLMFAESVPAIMIGREVWGLPKKFGKTTLGVTNGSLKAACEFDGVTVAEATMGYRYEELDLEAARRAQETQCVVLKAIPDVDGSPRILELVRFGYTDIKMKGAWNGPVALRLTPHALAPLADLPVDEIVGSAHTLYDAVLPGGEIIHDYLRR